MDTTKACCPNPGCVARGQFGRGNLWIHSRKDGRYRCRLCGKTFVARIGTAYYRLHHDEKLMGQVVTLLAFGCPVEAIVSALGLDARTVLRWERLGGEQSRAVHEELVSRPQELGQVQMDEIRVRAQRGVWWMALALAVGPRLWLGGAVGRSRDTALIFRLVAQVKAAASALGGAILFCTDGLTTYASVIRKVFREAEPRDERGRPRLVEWPGILIAQVVKQYEKGRVVGVSRRVVQGATQLIETVRRRSQGGAGVINTAFIERFNATFRARLAALGRRTRRLARNPDRLERTMFLVGTVYNFCTDHRSLQRPGIIGGRKFLSQTPAMAAGITNHRWTIGEILSFRVPPQPWSPPTRRGRLSNNTKTLIQRWQR